MRILYGVCGEGMGHATRTKVVVRHLVRRGHEVLVAASDQAFRFLSRSLSLPLSLPGDAGGVRVIPIVGLGMRCAGGAMDLRATIEENARRLPQMMLVNAGAWLEAEAFAPDVVVTDYDSFATLFANARGLPVMSIDNAHVLLRCHHDPRIFASYADGVQALATFSELKTLPCSHYIVTSFFFPPLRPEHARSTTLVQPILREEVLTELALPRAEADHVLTYKTASLDDGAFVSALGSLPRQRFLVYGCAPDVRLPPNAIAKPFDEAEFIKDVATARAVVGNGGMSLLGEALSFGKPVYAVPVRGQFEQHLNACYLANLGYGVASDHMDPALLAAFVEGAPLYAAAVRRRPPHDGNAALYAALDALLPPRLP